MNKEKSYLFVNDYGMGGIWLYVIAKNPSDVTSKYPGLQYVPKRPDWLSDDVILKEYRLNEIPSNYDFAKIK
jgi:hypothetical protein